MGNPVSKVRLSHSPSGPQRPGPHEDGETYNWAPLSFKTRLHSFSQIKLN